MAIRPLLSRSKAAPKISTIMSFILPRLAKSSWNWKTSPRTPLPPLRAKRFVSDGFDSLQQTNRLALRGGSGVLGDVFQFHDDFARRGKMKLMMVEIFGAALLRESKGRIAITLIGAPRVHARIGLEGFFTCSMHGSAKGDAGQQLAVKDIGESLCGLIVNGPAGGHDSAHAHSNQLGRQVGG